MLSSVKRLVKAKVLRRNTHCTTISDEILFARSRVSGQGYFFPYGSARELDRRQLFILQNGFHDHLFKKYSHNSIRVSAGDTVIDCGSFVGGFTVAAAKAGAAMIHAIEPTPGSRRCAQLNAFLYQIDNVQFHDVAMSNQNGKSMLNLASTQCDNSLLAPDQGALGCGIEVETRTLQDFVGEQKIDPLGLFLKIEAEGLEPEIVEGMGDLRPAKVVVDVTAERDHSSPRAAIEKMFKNFGYKVLEHSKQCIFCAR